MGLFEGDGLLIQGTALVAREAYEQRWSRFDLVLIIVRLDYTRDENTVWTLVNLHGGKVRRAMDEQDQNVTRGADSSRSLTRYNSWEMYALTRSRGSRNHNI
jgi:hypothetical protein